MEWSQSVRIFEFQQSRNCNTKMQHVVFSQCFIMEFENILCTTIIIENYDTSIIPSLSPSLSFVRFLFFLFFFSFVFCVGGSFPFPFLSHRKPTCKTDEEIAMTYEFFCVCSFCAATCARAPKTYYTKKRRKKIPPIILPGGVLF